jgi:predicted amino acid racemase
MSKGIESILITKQEIVVVPIAEPTIAQGVSMVVKVRYNEPKLNQQSGNIIKGISRD